MKSSNLAERVEFGEPERSAHGTPAPRATTPQDLPVPAPRGRRPFGQRAIVIRDQGFAPFRVF